MSYQRNRVKQSVTGSGASTLTLAAADSGFVTSESQYDTAERFRALIQQDADWEVSIVHYTGTTLTRQYCCESSNANAFVDFPAGTKTLSVVPVAARILAAAPLPAQNQATGFIAGDFVVAPPVGDPTNERMSYWVCTKSSDTTGEWTPLPRATFANSQNSQGPTLGGGAGNLAGGQHSAVIGGEYNYAGKYSLAAGKGAVCNSNGGVVAAGGGYLDEGAGLKVARATASLGGATAKTTDATPKLITFDFEGTYGEYVDVGVVRASAKIAAFELATGDCKEWTVEAFARMTDGWVSLALIGTPSVSSAFATAGAAAWTVAVAVNAVDETLEITVTGEAAHTIYWGGAITKLDLVLADSAA